MRSITKTVLLASVLATAHVTGVLPVSSSVQAAEAASQETVNLTISGMTWKVNCPKKVRSALEKVKGVVSAEVTHPDKAVVKVEKGKVETKQLIDAVKKAGYTAELKTEKS